MADLTPLDRLKANLRTSSIQKQNQPLFQVIDQLIGFVRDLQSTVNDIETTDALTSTPYLEIASDANQQPVVTTPVQVTFNHLIISNKCNFASNSVTITEAGVYTITGYFQTGETNPGHVNIDVWVRLNGVDVPFSNCRDFVSGTTDTTVIVTNVLLNLKATDVITIFMSVDDATKNAGLIHLAPGGEPVIPSASITLVKVSS